MRITVNMSKEKFPDWAPKEVIAEWQEKIDEIEYWLSKFPQAEKDTEEADLLYRLLTYPDMKNVWSRLPKYKIKPSHFSNMTLLSCHYPYYSPSNLAPKNHQMWLEDVKDTALKLAKLINLSEFDRILDAQYYKKRDKYLIQDMVSHAFQILRPGVEKEDLGEAESSRWPDLSPGDLSKSLRYLASLDSEEAVMMKGIERVSIKLDKPNHKNAKRIYFIKQLTKLLLDFTNQPLREVVTITTATIFDDPSITKRQIIRIAPSLGG